MIESLEVVARSSLILLCGLVAQWLMRRRPAAWRHSLLAVAIALAAMQPLIKMLVPPVQIPIVQWTPEVSADIPSHPPGSATPVEPAGRPFDWALFAFRLWWVGVAVSGSTLLVAMAWLHWLGARAADAGPAWYHEADDLRRRLGIRRPVRLAVTRHPALLVTWGAVAPVILLPASADQWPADRIRVVLSHELAHLARRDWLVQLLAEVSRALNWFNPLFWIACERLRRDSEHATDDVVIDLGIGRTSYASHLLDLARTFSVHGRTWLPAPSMARPSTLERRVRAMLNPQLDRRPVSRLRRVAVAVAMLALALPIAVATQGTGAPMGTVSDPSGKPLADATLRLVPADAGVAVETRSDAAGRFEFPQVPAGDYMLSVSYPGFSSKRHRIQLNGGAVTLSLQVQVGTLQETVTIDATKTGEREIYERPGYPAPTCEASAAGGRVSPPAKIRDVRPRYKQEWLTAGLSGQVLLQATIGRDGRVRSVDVLTQGNPELGDEALAAVSQWQFSPTYLNCQPIEVQMYVTVTFKADR
ncbi:MAG TPA: M56 family metallopeptidase [Vicinamibacterales bacterium]|nr:M56 family metallopeptidase [Vicinamibacterales bacterium]